MFLDITCNVPGVFSEWIDSSTGHTDLFLRVSENWSRLDMAPTMVLTVDRPSLTPNPTDLVHGAV